MKPRWNVQSIGRSPAKDMINNFKIGAVGEHFDPESYLEHASFEIDRVWHRGDSRGCGTVPGKYSNSGFEKILGDGLQVSVPEQQQIAVEFIEQYEQELTELSRFAGVDAVRLMLHYRQDVTGGILGYGLAVSPRLMYFAVKTGVVLGLYIDVWPDWPFSSRRDGQAEP